MKPFAKPVKRKFALPAEAQQDAQTYEVPDDVSKVFRRRPIVVNRFYQLPGNKTRKSINKL